MSPRGFGSVFSSTRSLGHSRKTTASRRRFSATRRMPLAAESLESRAMLATTALATASMPLLPPDLVAPSATSAETIALPAVTVASLTSSGSPTALAAVPGDARVNLTWSAPASNGGATIRDYVVQYSSNAGTTWSTFADPVSAATCATVTGLTNGARSMFRVAAVNAAGTGTRSDSSAAFVPATFGGFSEFSAPTQMVTGTAVPISGRLFDQDGTAVDAIRVYRDADGNGVLDLTIDQLLHADPTPGDGFEWDTSTLASGVHRLFTAAMKGGSVVASTPLTVTASQWWELSIGPTTHGKALYTATGELSTGLPQGVGKPVYVAPGTDINDAWIAAVNEHVSGTIEVHHNGKKLYEYAFGSAAFRVGLLGALATQVSNDPNAKNKFGITLPDDTKLIVLEDLTSAKSNDFDYDDQYWVVTWSPLLVDLDVDSDNTGTLDHTAHEDDIEEGTNDEGVIVRPGVIVPVGGGRVKMVANVPEGFTATLAFANGVGKVEVYAQETGGEPALEDERNKKTTTIVGGSPQTFWIEAFAPSESMADIAFTLTLDDSPGSSSTGSGSTGSAPRDTIRATAVAVDLDVDELPDEREDIGAGAIVWRNSDFSRLLPHPDPAKRDAEPGLRRYAPDYSDSRAIDPEYATQFTPGRATFTPGATDWFDSQFIFDTTKIALWTRESWVGFDEVTAEPDGWWKIPAGKSVRPGPGDNGERIDFWIEGLAATGYGSKELELLTLPKPGAARPLVPPPDVVKFTVVDVGLGVDGNRDGTIDFADSHDRQLTFWLNNDSERDDDPWTGSPYELENPLYGSGSTKDSADRRITTLRDLEDFASLHFLADENLGLMIHAPDGGADPLRPTYRYRVSLAAADTQIRLFQNRPQAEALAHVSDVAAARNLKSLHAAEPDVGRGLTVLTSLEPPAADDRVRYLFEAFGEPGRAALEFTVTVTYPNFGGVSGGTRWPRTTSRTHTLDLDLRDIKDLYTRMQVPYRIGGRDDRFTHFVPGTTEDLPHFGAAQPLHSGNTRGIPFLSGTDTVVLVHGWNMTDGTQTSGPNTDWKRANAETAFKRLYWQGFRGNVSAFDWPTFADQEGSLQGDLEWLNLTYNASEYQAFRSGRSLMTFLADKKATGPVHLLAHSLGNVVAAEALRQWTAAGNGQALVSNYVAMQGALSAGAYGDDATDATVSGIDYYRHWPAGWNGDTNRYYMQGTDQAAGKWINMFNELDRATSSNLGWVGNNRMKPASGDIWRVQSATGSPTAERIAYRVDRPEYGARLLRYYAVDNGPWSEEIELKQWLVAPGPGQLPGPSAYEVLAFMSKASAKPIGTKSVRFFGPNNIDISDLGLSDPYLREWSGHSFQFHFDAATTSQFWKSVVDETGMNTVSKPRNS